MKLKLIPGIVLIILGILLSIFCWQSCGGTLVGDYLVFGITVPLIFVGILFLFSTMGGILSSIGFVGIFIDRALCTPYFLAELLMGPFIKIPDIALFWKSLFIFSNEDNFRIILYFSMLVLIAGILYTIWDYAHKNKN